VPRYRFNQAALERLSPAERERALVLLSEFEDARRGNPLESFNPWGVQRPFLASHHLKHRLLAGGNRGGKTTAGIVNDIIQVTPWEELPRHLHFAKKWDCPNYGRIVAPDYDSAIETVIFQKIKDWIPRTLLRGGDFRKSLHKGKFLFLECGCRIDFMTFNQDLEQFGGSALHWMHHDEEPPEDIRIECLARLADFNGSEIFTMTPLKGMTWTFDKLVERAGVDPDVGFWAMDAAQNPHLSPEGLAALYKELTPDERKARQLGIHVHFGGMVYEDWQSCEVPPFRIGDIRYFDKQVAIDPGIRNPACSFIGYDRWNRAKCFDELHMPDANVDSQVANIKARLGQWEIPLADVRFVIDPAALQREKSSGRALIQEYRDRGLFAVAGNNDVKYGLQQMRDRQATTVNGERAWQFGSNCVRHAWEYRRYRKRDDLPSDEDAIVKEHDHCMDADRYGVCDRPFVPPSQVAQRGPSSFAIDEAAPPATHAGQRSGTALAAGEV
jgi:phage terminase large subunit-like protein